jgi:type II secretory pathway pseudopilin PulG
MNKEKGFSILEIIASIAIITIGLIGVLSLIVQNIQVQKINKNNLIALQLAQEGIELTRRERDNNWLNGNSAFSDITEVDNLKSFAIDSNGIIDGVLIGDNAARLTTDTGYYLHGGSDISIFRRIVETNNNYSASSTEVDCIVQWTEKNQTFKQTISAVLYDWR